MNRRNFLGSLAIISGTAITGTALVGTGVWKSNRTQPKLEPAISPILEDAPASSKQLLEAVTRMSAPGPDRSEYLQAFTAPSPSSIATSQIELTRYLDKMENFESLHQEDVFVNQTEKAALLSSFKRIDRVQTLVGHGNFNVLGFDSMLKYARQNRTVGAFSKAELEFLEALFFDDVERYGFFGEKVIGSLTAVVNERNRVKVPHTGHFLFKGESQQVYEKIRADIGDSIILTSGIRGIVKQTHLFLAKTIQSEGNLSLASRSLAPPGHSFHGIGDFDVGKLGFGVKNFTTEFAETVEYKRLVDLGYLDMRYPEQNLLGVRFEPWHIKVA